ncbi:hypothetical protein DNH61_19245 [Paenibacillus sambharensis]|uniref:Uncharacterized protein n=1 Tax=Paenibacillus sambharensis TaxID=1803190 RepID=A0A2W1LHV6_9BACL|nr:hypothetical protein [Paenibacillus sambharensis]PZD94094.1 hypothetical protein DNH61_19245 [Paenibacillus sambharensis]
MLDHYQIQLTRLLEAEQFGEAKQLLRFLLNCQGEEEHHYEEWRNLLAWIEVAFPDKGDGGPYIEEAEDEDERLMRERALGSSQADNTDEDYVRQVLHIMQHHPVLEQQLLALERAVYLRSEEVDRTLLEWLSHEPLHPAIQFKALQCLRRRGVSGRIHIADRVGESVELDIESTPLAMEEFPEAVVAILERVEQITEVSDPTLPHFARELWKEYLQFLYGTSDYNRMLDPDEAVVDSWAAALHMNLLLVAYGSADDEAIRDTYGIPESLRFRYEQACRALRRVGITGIDPSGQP